MSNVRWMSKVLVNLIFFFYYFIVFVWKIRNTDRYKKIAKLRSIDNDRILNVVRSIFHIKLKKKIKTYISCKLSVGFVKYQINFTQKKKKLILLIWNIIKSDQKKRKKSTLIIFNLKYFLIYSFYNLPLYHFFFPILFILVKILKSRFFKKKLEKKKI